MRGGTGAPPKSLDSDENFKPRHMLYCRELRFVAIYALFGDRFGSKTVFLGQEVHYYMVYIAYSKLVKFANLQLRAKTTHLSQKL